MKKNPDHGQIIKLFLGSLILFPCVVFFFLKAYAYDFPMFAGIGSIGLVFSAMIALNILRMYIYISKNKIVFIDYLFVALNLGIAVFIYYTLFIDGGFWHRLYIIIKDYI
ncbi:MAG: hypothetical protein NZM04_08125 [Methylacidiphilales bacterium]|nr:hypothetical protein [Candidatus Methylacidiphilales bacterium]